MLTKRRPLRTKYNVYLAVAAADAENAERRDVDTNPMTKRQILFNEYFEDRFVTFLKLLELEVVPASQVRPEQARG